MPCRPQYFVSSMQFLDLRPFSALHGMKSFIILILIQFLGASVAEVISSNHFWSPASHLKSMIGDIQKQLSNGQFYLTWTFEVLVLVCIANIIYLLLYLDHYSYRSILNQLYAIEAHKIAKRIDEKGLEMLKYHLEKFKKWILYV